MKSYLAIEQQEQERKSEREGANYGRGKINGGDWPARPTGRSRRSSSFGSRGVGAWTWKIPQFQPSSWCSSLLPALLLVGERHSLQRSTDCGGGEADDEGLSVWIGISIQVCLFIWRKTSFRSTSWGVVWAVQEFTVSLGYHLPSHLSTYPLTGWPPVGSFTGLEIRSLEFTGQVVAGGEWTCTHWRGTWGVSLNRCRKFN